MKFWILCALIWTSLSAFTLTTEAKRLSGSVHVVSKQAHIDITTKKVVRIDGPIFLDTIRKAALDLLATANLPGDRVVILDSPGGSVTAGKFFIEDLLREKKKTGERIICVAVDDAHSMAFNILSFCDVRLATPHTFMVVHKIAISMLGPEQGRLTAKRLREIADDLEKTDQEWRIKNATMMHLSLKDYDKYADDQREWTAEELLDMGYLNGLAAVK